MNKVVSMDDLIPLIEEKLDNGGKVLFTPKGNSMLPMLRNARDNVVLEAVCGKLRKYDIPLYKRDSGQYVMHRIVNVNADGTYNMCGDNQCKKEKSVDYEQIVGIVTEFTRKGKTYSVDNGRYKMYCIVWTALLPIRLIYIKSRKAAGKVKRKILRMSR